MRAKKRDESYQYQWIYFEKIEKVFLKVNLLSERQDKN